MHDVSVFIWAYSRFSTFLPSFKKYTNRSTGFTNLPFMYKLVLALKFLEVNEYIYAYTYVLQFCQVRSAPSFHEDFLVKDINQIQ